MNDIEASQDVFDAPTRTPPTARRSYGLARGAGTPEEEWSPCTISVALTRRFRAVDRVAPGFGPNGSEEVSSGPFFFCSTCATIATMSFASARARFFVALALSPLVGCLDKPYDPDGPGEFIGVFSVDAKQEANSCGAGALDAPASWTFDVRLSREVGVLLWNNGTEYIEGELSSDKRVFSFATSVIVDMRDQNSPAWLPPCSIARADRSNGTIAGDDASFTGKLSYDFAPTSGSDCTDLVTSAMPEFAALPCGISYTLEAKRTSTTF